MRSMQFLIFLILNNVLIGQNTNVIGAPKKFIPFLSQNETVLDYTFHEIITKKGNENLKTYEYILRNFYVKRNGDLILTDYFTFSESKLKLKEGYTALYFDDGSIKSQGFYMDNEREGNWIHGDTLTGNFSLGSYSKGKENGIWKEYSNHRVRRIYQYVNGKKNGEFTEFDSLGIVINHGKYRNDSILHQLKIDTTDQLNIPPIFGGCETKVDYLERKRCSDEKMMIFLNSNLKYPSFAKKNRIQGKVMVTFVIEMDGTISTLKVIRGLCDHIRDEAMRVVYKMPKFYPGYQNEKPVRVQFNLPLTFNLD